MDDVVITCYVSILPWEIIIKEQEKVRLVVVNYRSHDFDENKKNGK